MKEPGMYRGIILKESLKNQTLPRIARHYLDAEYPYMLDGECKMSVFRLIIPARQIRVVVEELSYALKPEKFFAQFTGEYVMFVVFPGVWVTILKDQPEMASAARLLGAQFGIPEHQMKFEEMFEKDHPNTKDAD